MRRRLKETSVLLSSISESVTTVYLYCIPQTFVCWTFCSLYLSQTLGACSCQNTCFFLPGVSGLTGMVRALRKVDESNTDTITGDRIKCNSVFPEHRRWERFWLSTQSNRESEGNVNVSQVLMNCEGAFWKNSTQRWNHMREHPTFKDPVVTLRDSALRLYFFYLTSCYQLNTDTYDDDDDETSATDYRCKFSLCYFFVLCNKIVA